MRSSGLIKLFAAAAMLVTTACQALKPPISDNDNESEPDQAIVIMMHNHMNLKQGLHHTAATKNYILQTIKQATSLPLNDTHRAMAAVLEQTISMRQGLDEPMQEKWFAALADSRQRLKEESVPTLFVGIDNYSRLYPADEPRDPDLLNRLHLTRANPQPGETIFVKRYMDALTDIDQVLTDPVLRKYLEGQRQDQKTFHEGIINGTLPKDFYFGRPTLHDHLKASGVEQISIMGEKAGFCITDTALSAAMHGFDVTIISNRVVGWEDNTYRKAAWHPNSPEHHQKEITDALDEVIRSPESRGF